MQISKRVSGTDLTSPSNMLTFFEKYPNTVSSCELLLSLVCVLKTSQVLVAAFKSFQKCCVFFKCQTNVLHGLRHKPFIFYLLLYLSFVHLLFFICGLKSTDRIVWFWALFEEHLIVLYIILPENCEVLYKVDYIAHPFKMFVTTVSLKK